MENPKTPETLVQNPVDKTLEDAFGAFGSAYTGKNSVELSALFGVSAEDNGAEGDTDTVNVDDLLGVDGSDVLFGETHENGIGYGVHGSEGFEVEKKNDDVDLDKNVENFEENKEVLWNDNEEKEKNEDGFVDKECSFVVGDFVWVEDTNHDWRWPGLICDPSDESKCGPKNGLSDTILVRYFGEDSHAWCSPLQLKPFYENFQRLSLQSKAKSFLEAVEQAVDEMGQQVKLQMTCHCVSKETQNGIGDRNSVNELSVTQFDPANFLARLKYFSRITTMPCMLEFTITLSCLSTFYRSIGHLQLPANQIKTRTDEENDSRDVSPAKIDDEVHGGERNTPVSVKKQALNLEEDVLEGKKHETESKSLRKRKRKKEPEARNGFDEAKFYSPSKKEKIKLSRKVSRESSGNAGFEKMGRGSESRERKKSKYLSYPYVNIGSGLKGLPTGDDFEEKEKKGSSHKGKDKNKAVKIDAKPKKKTPKKSDSEDEPSDNEVSVDRSSSAMLSDLRITALDCLYPEENLHFDAIESFFSGFRQSVFRNIPKEEIEDGNLEAPEEVPTPERPKLGSMKKLARKKGSQSPAIEPELEKSNKRKRLGDGIQVEIELNTNPTVAVPRVNGNLSIHESEKKVAEVKPPKSPKKKAEKKVNGKGETRANGSRSKSKSKSKSEGKKKKKKEVTTMLGMMKMNRNSVVPMLSVKDLQALAPLTALTMGAEERELDPLDPWDPLDPLGDLTKGGEGVFDPLSELTKGGEGVFKPLSRVTKGVEGSFDPLNKGGEKEKKEATSQPSPFPFENHDSNAGSVLKCQPEPKKKTPNKEEKQEATSLPTQHTISDVQVSDGLKRKRGRKKKVPITNPIEGIPDLNGNNVEPTTGVEPERKKRRKKGEMLSSSVDATLTYSRVESNREAPSGTALLLKFAPGDPLPLKEELVSKFSSFGSLKESETQVFDVSTSAQVVFLSNSDAGDAFRSLEKESPFGPFGPSIVNYRLHNLSDEPIMPTARGPKKASKSATSKGSSTGTKPKIVKIAEAPALSMIRKNLEMMTSMLEKAGDNLSPAMRTKLEGEINGLMKKVSTMVGSSASSS